MLGAALVFALGFFLLDSTSFGIRILLGIGYFLIALATGAGLFWVMGLVAGSFCTEHLKRTLSGQVAQQEIDAGKMRFAEFYYWIAESTKLNWIGRLALSVACTVYLVTGSFSWLLAIAACGMAVDFHLIRREIGLVPQKAS